MAKGVMLGNGRDYMLAPCLHRITCVYPISKPNLG